MNANLGGREDSPLLLLGLGPEPTKALQRFAPGAWVENQQFLEALAKSRNMTVADLVPASARGWRLDPDQAAAFLRKHKPRVIMYRQGPLLYPEFWQTLLAKLQLAAAPTPRKSEAKPFVLLPGQDMDLLHQDLKLALRQAGLQALPADPKWPPEQVHELILRFRPLFCLTVNLHGLDQDGKNFYLLRELGIPVAAWFVDNPWLILSKQRLDWWKQAWLFVTGAGFVTDLERHGAQKVWHLPLASSDFFHNPDPAPLPARTKIVFAGRAAFQDKDKYFRAAHLPAAVLEQARGLDGQADFNWWRAKLLLNSLWPGQQARQAGLGAETMGQERRILWLSAAANLGLRVYGGNDWAGLLPPGADIQPPVDYYTQLPGIYRSAPFCLNLTSPLLPGALTQRNFDVWRAGGFLFSPPEPGLAIFPSELVQPILIQNPQELAEGMRRIAADPETKRELIKEWQSIVEKEHTYRLRVKFIGEKLGLLDRMVIAE